MSGSNMICVVTVLLETGVTAMQEPVTELTLEAPAGGGMNSHWKTSLFVSS